MGVLFWIVLTVVLLVIEATTLGLVTVWFAAGAFVSMLLSLAVKNAILEWIVFVIVSGITLILVRPLLADKVNANIEATNIDSVVGKKAKVVEKIDNINETGSVFFKGITWKAVSDDSDKVIEAGTVVIIKEVEGVKLIVKEN